MFFLTGALQSLPEHYSSMADHDVSESMSLETDFEHSGSRNYRGVGEFNLSLFVISLF